MWPLQKILPILRGNNFDDFLFVGVWVIGFFCFTLITLKSSHNSKIAKNQPEGPRANIINTVCCTLRLHTTKAIKKPTTKLHICWTAEKLFFCDWGVNIGGRIVRLGEILKIYCLSKFPTQKGFQCAPLVWLAPILFEAVWFVQGTKTNNNTSSNGKQRTNPIAPAETAGENIAQSNFLAIFLPD